MGSRRQRQASRVAADPDPALAPRGAALWPAIVLIVLSLGAYSGVVHHDFVNFDDGPYVSQNPEVLSGLTWHGVAWAFTTGHAGNWHPVTWLSHMLDVQLFGAGAGAHHVTSVLLHAASTALLFLFLLHTTRTRWASFFVAALFAVHPLHVESVAWIAERKDVLSTFFMMLTLLAYVRYTRSRSVGSYFLVMALYALGLMAKPMLVTLPFVLLLVDYWPLRRTGRLLLEKLPLFALAAASSVVTFVVQQQAGAVRALDVLPFSQRAANAVVAYVIYLFKMIWPASLAAIYPYRAWSVGEVLAATAVLAIVTILAVQWRSRRPYLLVGWLWFLGTLVPVIGLVQVGSQPVADRYTYVPAVGIFLMAAWAARELLEPRRARLAAALGGGVVAICTVLTYAQAQVWANGVTLWQHAIAVTSDNYRAHGNLGQAFAKANRLDDAMSEYREALRIFPDSVEVHNNLGLLLGVRGRLSEAAVEFAAATRLNPGFGAAHLNLALALTDLDRPAEAIPHFQESVRLGPADDAARAEHGWGRALADLGRLDESLPHFEAALARAPEAAAVHHDRGRTLAQMGRTDDAIAALQRATQLAPNDADIHFDLAVVLIRKGRTTEAAQELRRVLQIDPSNAAARDALAKIGGGA